MITIPLSLLIHRYCPRSSAHSTSYYMLDVFACFFSLHLIYFSVICFMIEIDISLYLYIVVLAFFYTGKLIQRPLSLNKNTIKIFYKRQIYIFNKKQQTVSTCYFPMHYIGPWIKKRKRKKKEEVYTIYYTVHLPLHTTEEAHKKVLPSTLLQLEDSWACWVFISFKQQDCFLAVQNRFSWSTIVLWMREGRRMSKR